MGVAVGDYDNDGFPDVLVTCVGQNRLFRNTGRGTFVDVTRASGLDGRIGLSTSAMWVDIDRDGHLDLFVCNYVKWSLENDVFCSADGKRKSYCTPEAYRGDTCWLFRNRGNGTFEDVTATCGIFDSSSKALGVALVDHDQDGWPDIFVANDTQPNKLYRNLRNGRFRDVALEAGVALSEDGKARAGMGVDVAYLDASGRPSVAVTNFEGEMLGLYSASQQAGHLPRHRHRVGHGRRVAQPARVRLRLCGLRPRRRRSIWWWPTATSTPRSATSAAASATPRRRISSSTRGAAAFGMWRRRSAAPSRRRASAAGWPAATSTATATWTCC